jgi:acyl-coenzyme A thioesterase PaaI-like protein
MPFETPALRGSHLYEHLGVRSRSIDDQSGETRMPVGDDIRVPGGLRAAPLGLAFENGVATYMFARTMAVPSQISLHVRDRGEGVEAIHSRTRIVRLGRSLVITDGEIHDADDATRLIAYGSITWSVIGEAPGARTDFPPLEIPDFESSDVPLPEAAGIEPLADGSGVRLGGVSEQAVGPGGILHAGMFQLLSEEAARVAAGGGVAVDCTYNFLQAGKVGPFVATAEVLARGEEGVDTRVSIRDEGNDDRVGCLSFVRVRPR